MSGPEHLYRGWRKASRSGGNNGNCVEVGFAPGMTGVRDTKEAADPGRATLEFGGTAFAAFLSRVKSGDLDHA